MTVAELLEQTTQRLSQAGIVSARLDSQILLCDALGCDKSWLLANPESKLAKGLAESIEPLIAARAKRIPLAYLRGNCEFYGRLFKVDPNVLIPRPETESLIELIKKYAQPGLSLLEVGTGSGIIAVTAGLEVPRLNIEACDINPAALKIAVHNAALQGARVRFFQSDLLAQAKGPYDVIVANLPYVGRTWEVSPETAAEPAEALYADDDGLALINQLIATAPGYLAPRGYLVLEADPRQHEAIKKTALQHAFQFIEASGLGLCFARQ